MTIMIRKLKCQFLKLVNVYGFIHPKLKKVFQKNCCTTGLVQYWIVEQSSPVHFRLRTDTNKKVTFAVHANRMKLFIDPDLRPIDPPLFKLVKCRPLRSDYRPVTLWKTSDYLITLLPCFNNSWRIQRNFRKEMASSSAGPRTLSFIFDEPMFLARSKSSPTTIL